ncbi:MAG: ribosome maturation factor RimP [Clostridia bacterium]|nr:ribosome maturation factor RimP [Clostridia bacterium]
MMKKEYTGIPAKALPVVAPAAEAAGCCIWDIEFVKEGPDRILRITIDTEKEGGIGIADCEAVHREADRLLDETDPVGGGGYTLEISSPGIERKLTMPLHFDACAGCEAEIKLFKPLEEDPPEEEKTEAEAESKGKKGGSKKGKAAGRKKYTGVIEGYDEASDSVVLETRDGRLMLPFTLISSANLVYDFDADPGI